MTVALIRVDSSVVQPDGDALIRITDINDAIHEFMVEASALDGMLLRVGVLSNERLTGRALIEPPGLPKAAYFRLWVRWSDLIHV